MHTRRASPQEDRTESSGGWFAHPAEALTSALTDRLRERIAGVADLSGPAAWIIYRDARSHLQSVTQQQLNRVLLLELHAASMAGELGRGDEKARWAAFVDRAATPQFRAAIAERYPTLLTRIDAAGRSVIEAVGTLAERLVADRPDLERLAAEADATSDVQAQPLGELRSLRLGAGDPHRGGHTVSRLEFEGAVLMYKPRPLEVDAALDTVLATLLPQPERIRTARTLARDGYGWSAFIEHRYCADDDETEIFYANLGRWLAVMRLIGGTDLHAENIVAHGPIPVVVDAETMLASPAPPTHAGTAADVASQILHHAVLRTGILPMRVDLLSGIDVSAVGRLAGEQPALTAPIITGGGTDSARLAYGEARIAEVRNHPNPDPVPERFWEHIVSGFLELSTRMRTLDDSGRLDSLLDPFLGCEVRRVVRSTQVYGDIRRMLWHPAALHDEPTAIEHARAALRRHARGNPIAPGDDTTINAEIAELLIGDTPVFTAHIDEPQLTAALDNWRAVDLELEARLIRFSLAGVYRDGFPRGTTTSAKPAITTDASSRKLAADAVRTLRDTAIHGAADSVTWIGPVIGEKGWTVRALGPDLHSGLPGVALCLAGYVNEVAAGRADHVDGISELLPGTLSALRAAEDQRRSHRIGALVGLAGQVWTWTTLSRLLDDRALLDRAVARAVLLGKGLHADSAQWSANWSSGLAGTITPLLGLVDATGDDRWLDLAATGADLLSRLDSPSDVGFIHGQAGIGWALHRISSSEAGDDARRDHWRAVADNVFDPIAAIDQTADDSGWCRGVAGIGLVACDLANVDAARHAAELQASSSEDDSRSLCHGAAGTWEFRAAAARLLAQEITPQRLIDVLEQEPTTTAQIAESVAPGLLNGVSGTVLTLLRMHPEHELPSPLLLGA